MNSFDELKEKLRQELEEISREIQTVRDEIKLHTHLAQQELRDEFNIIENKYDHYKNKFESLKKEAELTNQTALKELHSLGQEIAKAYRRLRDTLNK